MQITFIFVLLHQLEAALILLLLILFLISAFIQCLFYLIAGITWGDSDFLHSFNKQEKEPASIIVAARNEAENLKTLIPALLSQEYPDFEVVVALDRCSDQSRQVLENFDCSQLKIILIDELPKNYSGKKNALATAIRSAQNDLLVFTDADCIPASDRWLEQVNQAFGKQTMIGAGYSPYRKEKGFLNRLIRYETIITALQYFSFAAVGIPYMGVGRNMAYRRSFFHRSGEFGQFSGVVGGDDDLFISHHATRKNYNSYYNRQSLVYSKTETSWKNWFNQKKRHLSVGKYYPKKHSLLLGLLGSSQIVFWLTFAILALLNANPAIVLSCLLVRYVCYYWFLVRGLKKTGESFALWWTPLLDIVHTLFLLVMGPVGFFTKKVKWN